MGATADRAAADLPLDGQTTKSSSSSFFSRWALPLPLRSRTRHLADFHIRPDEPHRQFSAGDHVTGTIVLTLIKPVRITHLTVALHGYVRVFKNAGAAAQSMPINPAVTPNEGSRSLKYFGNGHASLFQDEQVLCGEGRLAARKWEFKFDLVFPSKGLPSSIDFERGSISYVVSATLTRPTSISPTTCAERKVTLTEKLDIGLLPTPRERNVTMQAMPKKPRRRRTTATATTPTTIHRSSFSTETPETVSDLDSMRAHENSNGSPGNAGEPAAAAHDGLVTPRSPIPSDMQSEISGESAASTSSNPARGASGSVAGSKHSGMGAEDREITATVELLKGGCLPGDPLPVRIKISHNRRIKSMHGIIVTFYRQGRVDYAPPPSLFKDLSEEEIRRLEREEYYPKSKTGLGGLSLSSAGSCSVFRKDLSQSVAPLIIDPLTLTANITTAVRVPEDVFPSIRGVPGGLVSFKYYVEVVIDLGGRLSGQTQGSVPQPTRMGSVSGPAGAPASSDHLSRLANWNGTIVDTDTIRREKGVIYVPIEVVVGTVDSTRSRGKSAVRPALSIQPPTGQESPYGPDHTNYTWQGTSDDDYYNEMADFSTPFKHSQSYFPPPSAPQTPHNDHQNQDLQAPAYIPPPQLPRQDTMTDKERARQAEMRLLPSQPLDPSEARPSQAGPSQPSAPDEGSQSNSHAPSQPDGAVVRSLPAPEDDQGPSVPTLDDLLPAGSSHPNEDKQELERRRLLLEASAPPEVPDDFNGEPSAPPLAPTGPLDSHEPSAPTLGEDDTYGSHDTYGNFAGPSTGSHSTGHGHGAEQLPKYER